VRVNDVIGVAGYVLPGTHVDVLATATPTQSEVDTTTKVVLTNVQVLAAGTKMEQDSEQGKPMAVNVVTLLVSPDEAERLTLRARRDPGQDSARASQPARQDHPRHAWRAPGGAARSGESRRSEEHGHGGSLTSSREHGCGPVCGADGRDHPWRQAQRGSSALG